MAEAPRHLLLTLALLVVSTAAAAAELRAPLDVWGLGQCPNELAFWHSYRTDAEFRRRLDEQFVVRRLLIGHFPIQALLKGIIAGPTFAVPGRPLVVGFRGPAQLLHELGVPLSEADRHQWQEEAPPHQPEGEIVDPAEIKRLLADELRDALEAARQADRAAVQQQLQALQRRLEAQATGQGQLPQDVLLALQQQAADIERLRQQLRTPPAPTNGHTPDPEPDPKARPLSPPSGASAWNAPGRLGHLLLTSLPWLLPLATGGGTVGAVWLATRLLARGVPAVAHAVTRATDSASPSPCRDCPALRDELAQARRQLDDLRRRPAGTQFVPVESARFREAFESAVRETVRRYPGTEDTITVLRNYMNQYLPTGITP